MKQKLTGLGKVVLMIAAVAVLAGCGTTKQENAAQASTEKTQDAESVSDVRAETSVLADENDALVIPVDNLSETVLFYPVEIDGISMEVMAAKDAQGDIHLAFNTCQVCYSSGKGYYKQEGDMLVCQNCGNRFTIDQLGEEAGGCNPIPITASDYESNGQELTIPYSFLAQYEGAF